MAIDKEPLRMGKKPKKKKVFPPITPLGYKWVESEVASKDSYLDIEEKMVEALSKVPLMNVENDDHPKVEPCSVDNQIFLSATPNQTTFTYLYLTIFRDIGFSAISNVQC